MKVTFLLSLCLLAAPVQPVVEFFIRALAGKYFLDLGLRRIQVTRELLPMRFVIRADFGIGDVSRRPESGVDEPKHGQLPGKSRSNAALLMSLCRKGTVFRIISILLPLAK